MKRNRLTAFFRLLMCIPHAIVSWFYGIGVFFVDVRLRRRLPTLLHALQRVRPVAIGIWFVALATGKTPPGMSAAMHFPMSYYVRSTAYVYLITDIYPPISDTDALLPAGAMS